MCWFYPIRPGFITPSILQSVPVLSFIMDNLLAPPSKDAGQNVEDSHESAKVLLSTIAASNSIEPTKEKFVDQLKYSFTNALST